jgi:hypothetical protein
MEIVNRPFRESGERLSALALAVAVTVFVLVAIDAGFTPHATELASQTTSQHLAL